jgi:membrane-associated protein
MESLQGLLHQFLQVYNVEGVIRWGGLAVVLAFIYSETGLMVGFFLPGDSLIVSAGLFAARGDLSLPGLVFGGMVCAIAGTATGYWIGRKAGEPLYHREKTWFFRRDHLLQAKEYYERHGGKTIVIAQFIPILRTFAPVVAGVAQMRYRRFAMFNSIGAVSWIGSMSMIGYTLGRVFPAVVKRIDLLIVVIIAISLLPLAFEFLRHRRRKAS